MTSPSAAFLPFKIDGGVLPNNRDPSEVLLSANADLSMDQESEISMELNDPGFMYFSSFKGGRGPVGKALAFNGVPYECADVSLSPGPTGQGGMTIRVRPQGVQKLRKVKGALTRTNLSSTQYVKDAVTRQGMKFIGEPSTSKPSIARDVASEGADDTDANEWTTIQGLAGEEGFLAFELFNTLYYGSPQWLFDKMPNVKVTYGGLWHPLAMMGPPSIEIGRTKDDDDISFSLPLQAVGKILPGMSVTIEGVPFISPKLLVTGVSYPFAGSGSVSVKAKNPWKIEKQQRGAKDTQYNFNFGGTGSGNGGSFGPGGKGKRFYASEICNAAKERNLGRDGARNGIATALVETNLTMYANRAVPESLNYPHDAVGSDHDSVGLFQQRQAGWGTLAQRMNPRASAGLFFNAMMKFNWRAMDPGAACQKVQVSAYPGRYSERMGEATQWVNQVY